jgi:MSHA biogenesis protein MshE
LEEQRTTKRIRLGDILVAQHIITPDQLDLALVEQKKSGYKLGKQLVQLGLIKEDTLLELLSKQLHYPFVDLRLYRFDRKIVQKLPESVARRYRVLMLQEDFDGVLLGMSDPLDIFCLDDIQKILQKPIKPAVVRESDLLDILDVAYSRASEIASLAEQLDDELAGDAVNIADIISAAEDGDAPVARLLKKIFEEAVANRASDIHIEPDEAVLRIRQRIDGELIEQVMNEKRISAALVVRLKLMCGLDISEKRLPQDGRFNLKLENHSIDIRLSTMPVQYGESVVMRLLDHSMGIRPLSSAGMPEHYLRMFRQVISRPHGLILVTGPTGSGKTTTLYGALSELNTPQKKIITVEDPVEYRLPRINQVQLHEKIGLTFATVLRATLRQDPDILLIGEIRDSVSAEIALRASMTGHLVLSTLHTNDAVTSALRLLDMGVDRFLVASSLKAVVAQRLIRKNCSHCAIPYTPNEMELNSIKRMLREKSPNVGAMRKGAGCPHCFNTGFLGRIGVFEMLEINVAMADALRDGSVRQFNLAAHEDKNYRPLSYSALEYALQGVTTLEEVMRVTAEVEDESPSDVSG